MQHKNFKGFRNFMKGKGYYIVLLLCAVTVGVSGYLLLNDEGESLPAPSAPAETTRTPAESRPVPQTQPVLATEPEPSRAPDTEPPASGPPALLRPIQGEVCCAYAADRLVYNQTTRDWRCHEGVDYAAQAGASVTAALDGTVHAVYEDDQYGTTVVLRHSGGYTTHYGNLDRQVPVEVGQLLKAGQVLGTVGSTATAEAAMEPHLHFAVYLEHVPQDPAELYAGS